MTALETESAGTFLSSPEANSRYCVLPALTLSSRLKDERLYGVCARAGDVSNVSLTYTAEVLLFIMSVLTLQAMLLLAAVVMNYYLAAASIYRQAGDT